MVFAGLGGGGPKSPCPFLPPTLPLPLSPPKPAPAPLLPKPCPCPSPPLTLPRMPAPLQVSDSLTTLAVKRYTSDNAGVVVVDLKGQEWWAEAGKGQVKPKSGFMGLW